MKVISYNIVCVLNIINVNNIFDISKLSFDIYIDYENISQQFLI